MSEPEARDRLAFVICTEAGLLERKSVMLVKTLRAFGGRFADAPVLSYSPRPGREPDPTTLQALRRAGVETVVEPLNLDFADYGFGNKVVACAHAESRYGFRRLVFLDSDIFVLDEPAELWSDDPRAVKLRPVERRLAGSTGADEHAPYWRKLFDRAGVDEPGFVDTALTGERIYGYWNAGVISASPESGFFTAWLRTFRELVEEGLIHPLGMTFMDQVALALTVHAGPYEPVELPPEYNVPVNAWPDPGSHPDLPTPDELVIAHYHTIFDHFPLRNPLSPWMDPERHRGLSRIIGESGLVGTGGYLRYRLGSRLRSLLALFRS